MGSPYWVTRRIISEEGSGEWRVGSGKWGVGSGGWGVGSGEFSDDLKRGRVVGRCCTFRH
ncbi:MAG TPA: hypothetical protein DCY38_05125 [Opitutae bacterium]|nr:hypothetical protein [Opitutae bacterium]